MVSLSREVYSLRRALWPSRAAVASRFASSDACWEVLSSDARLLALVVADCSSFWILAVSEEFISFAAAACFQRRPSLSWTSGAGM